MLTPVTNGLPLPVDIDTGRVLAPNETGDADLDHPHNQALVASGALIVTKAQKAYDGMTAEELHQVAEGLGLDHKDLNKGPLLDLVERGRADNAAAAAPSADTTEPEEAS